MIIRVKTQKPEMALPKFGTAFSAGADLMAKRITKKNLFKVWYDIDLSMEIPQGHVGLLFPRSSISSKVDLQLANSVGVIDSDYRGTFEVRFNRTLRGFFTRKQYKIGDYIAQLVIVKIPTVEYVQANKLSNTTRNNGGFGSTDTQQKSKKRN